MENTAQIAVSLRLLGVAMKKSFWQVSSFSFDSEVTVNGTHITVKRSFVSNKTVYAPQDYPALKELMVAAVKAGHSHAILQHDPTSGG